MRSGTDRHRPHRDILVLVVDVTKFAEVTKTSHCLYE
jgi:hypothetical protein